jgi:hypothetical protein
VARVTGKWVTEAHRSAELRAVAQRDPDRALRLFAGPAGDLHQRLTDHFEALLRNEQHSGFLPHPMGLRDLAELLTRIADSYTWVDLVTGSPPNPPAARAAVEALLRP